MCIVKSSSLLFKPLISLLLVDGDVASTSHHLRVAAGLTQRVQWSHYLRDQDDYYIKCIYIYM